MFDSLTETEYKNLRRIVHAHSDESILFALKELRKEHQKLLDEIELKLI